MKPRMATGLLAALLAGAGGFVLVDALLSTVDVDGFWPALLAAAVAGAVNALAWPAVIRFVLPFTVLTLGLGVLALNGLVVLMAAQVLPGVEVDGLLAAVVVALVLTALTTLVSALLAIDDEDRVVRHLVRRGARRTGDVESSDVPGVLFLEIDGLAHEVLRRALRDGNAPALSRWGHEGSHRLVSWETDWSSQTGACQAGLLHGSNDDMPAFRWWEKERGRAIVTNHPRDAAELERRVSDGRGLLHAGGASRAYILSGDAPHTLLTMSTVLGIRRPGQRIGRDYYTYFASPYNVARTLLLSLADIVFELRAAAEQRRRDVRPRGHRGLRYHLARTDGFAHCPDILVNSTYWSELEEVAAFEELVGSHGGLGGPQSFPFLLAPAAFDWPTEPLVGAEAVHRLLRGWLADLGHAGYREETST